MLLSCLFKLYKRLTTALQENTTDLSFQHEEVAWVDSVSVFTHFLAMSAVTTSTYHNCCEFRPTTAAVLHDGEFNRLFRATLKPTRGKYLILKRWIFNRRLCSSPDGQLGGELLSLKGQEATKWKLLIELRMAVSQYYSIINILLRVFKMDQVTTSFLTTINHS